MEALVGGSKAPLVVITGPTGSGKTSLAVDLAERFGGEIICADSRTVYVGMDIGTAKPTDDYRSKVPHWGLDLLEPGEGPYTAADFQRYSQDKIRDIRSRGRVPFLVGGTGLYIDSVIFDYDFDGGPDQVVRRELEGLTLQELQQYCINNNVQLPVNSKNKRHIIRSIERKGAPVAVNTTLVDNVIVVGIATERDILRTRIELRTEQLFEDGVVEEAILLSKKYGWNNEAMTGNVYPIIRSSLEGQLSVENIKDKFTTSDWKLAKRQLTWMRRNPHVYWAGLTEAHDYISRSIAKRFDS